MIECVTHNFFSSQNCISIMLPKGSMVYQKESSLGNILTFSLTICLTLDASLKLSIKALIFFYLQHNLKDVLQWLRGIIGIASTNYTLDW